MNSSKNFLKERKRMCDSFVCCEECPADNDNSGYGGCIFSIMSEYSIEKQIDIVEKWSREHPAENLSDQLLK